MSIIYDALKKVEQSANAKEITPEVKKPAKLKTKIFLLYILVACVGFLISNVIFAYLTQPKKSQEKSAKALPVSAAKEEPKIAQIPEELPPSETPLTASSVSLLTQSKTAATTSDPQGSLVLNGVFFSEGEVCALINNKIVRVNDVIEGAVVKRINLDEVDLEAGGSTIKLLNRSN